MIDQLDEGLSHLRSFCLVVLKFHLPVVEVIVMIREDEAVTRTVKSVKT